MKKSLSIKIGLILKQNALAFSLFFSWFAINYIVFLIFSSPLEALLILFYFIEHASYYGHFYPIFSEFVIFGLIFSLITVELFRKYNPKETCRLLAKGINNHIILIGYTNLAERLRQHFEFIGKKYVIIEKDEKKAEELIDLEVPLIIDNPGDRTTLEAANIKEAKLVIIADDDIKLLFLSIEEIREINTKIQIIARCFDNDIAQILDRQFGCETISTSRFAAERIEIQAKSIRTKGIGAQIKREFLLIGLNHISERLGRSFKKEGRGFKIIDIPEYAEKTDFYTRLKEDVIVGIPWDPQFLYQIGIENYEIIIITIDDIKKVILILNQIREVNKFCKIICRVFSDDIAKIIERKPFEAIPISSSRATLDYLKERRLL
ncbi:MAG: hypothetical protein EAX96_19500 [Candidatus Lokiarchaeota archaeon]|nr:hypothetical protein [Candidatus Lokiarchaeota archaeon]